MALATSWLSITNYFYWARISCLPDKYSQKPNWGSASIPSIFGSPLLTHHWNAASLHWKVTASLRVDGLCFIFMFKGRSTSNSQQDFVQLSSERLHTSHCCYPYLDSHSPPPHTWNPSSLQEYETINHHPLSLMVQPVITHVVVCPLRP